MTKPLPSIKQLIATEPFVRCIQRDVFDVYVGRRMPNHTRITGETDGYFGNPFGKMLTGELNQHRGTRTRAGLLTLHWNYLHTRMAHELEFAERVRGLRGKRLGCWCAVPDLAAWYCHAQSLAIVANGLE